MTNNFGQKIGNGNPNAAQVIFVYDAVDGTFIDEVFGNRAERMEAVEKIKAKNPGVAMMLSASEPTADNKFPTLKYKG